MTLVDECSLPRGETLGGQDPAYRATPTFPCRAQTPIASPLRGATSRLAMRTPLFAALLLLSACIVEAPTKEGTQSSAPKPPQAPPAEVKSGANFGDVIELASVILNPSRGVVGEPVRVLANFKVLGKIDRDYMIFVHVEDVEGRVDRLNVDHAPRAKPTSAWQPGEVVQDVFDIPIPPQMPVRGLSLVLGFWDPKSDTRLPIKNPEQVPNDGRDRLFVAKFPVAQAQP